MSMYFYYVNIFLSLHSVCGEIKQDLNLSIREWICNKGHKLDRDLNASINILKEGLKILSAGTADYKGGEKNKTSSVLLKKHISAVYG